MAAYPPVIDNPKSGTAESIFRCYNALFPEAADAVMILNARTRLIRVVDAAFIYILFLSSAEFPAVLCHSYFFRLNGSFQIVFRYITIARISPFPGRIRIMETLSACFCSVPGKPPAVHTPAGLHPGLRLDFPGNRLFSSFSGVG